MQTHILNQLFVPDIAKIDKILVNNEKAITARAIKLGALLKQRLGFYLNFILSL